jgi:hypothetical protein
MAEYNVLVDASSQRWPNFEVTQLTHANRGLGNGEGELVPNLNGIGNKGLTPIGDVARTRRGGGACKANLQCPTRPVARLNLYTPRSR